MTYAVVYSSQTGNTKTLADRLQDMLGEEECVYFGDASDKAAKKAAEADFIFAGFWTDKGTCSGQLKGFLNSLGTQTLFLFGTAGFGGDKEYFDQILKRVAEEIPGTCKIAGTFMCQGRMQESVKKRYEAMQERNPSDDNAKRLLANYEKALAHPDTADLKQLEEDVKRIWKA